MSRIYFHSPSLPDVEVRGAERAYFAYLVNRIALVGWDTVEFESQPSWLRKVLPEDAWVRRIPAGSSAWKSEVEVYLLGMSMAPLRLFGKTYNIFDVNLNTALVLGSDAIRLAARIHGQCECHAWVSGVNREWLSDLIQVAVAHRVFRPDMGWEKVVELLQARDDEPVVLSYSVCDQFPSTICLPSGHPLRENDCDGWYDLPAEERWRIGLEWLPENAPELSPETWDDYHFMDGVTAMKLRQLVIEDVRAIK